MRVFLRQFADRAFTLLAIASVGLMAAALLIILGPMLYRGSGAVAFEGTVEFRKMQVERFGRGDYTALQAELAQVRQVRQTVYDMLDRFSASIDTATMHDKARSALRRLRDQLRQRDLTEEQRAGMLEKARQIRDQFEAALDATDQAVALAALDAILTPANEAAFAGTAAQEYFDLARCYRQSMQSSGIAHRDQYQAAAKEVQTILVELLGPRPGKVGVDLAQFSYGATRWDRAQVLLDQLLYTEAWCDNGQGQAKTQQRVARAKLFAGTELEPLFGLVEKDLSQMLLPQRTFYWQYFIDDSTPGHFFGGVGPETLGTIVLAVLSMLLAVPLGIVSAAYLVECGGDNWLVRVIRTCINTLSGVPSIVFGIFGMIFFVLVLMPATGLPSRPCVLAGGMTLGLMVLPVIIRASEEAIKAVPRTYKEAALAVGASPFRAFVTVTLPAALPGILTGAILSLSRAAGETAPILFVAGVAVGPPLDFTKWDWMLHPTRTLSYGAWNLAVGDRLAAKVPHNQYGMVMTLILVVLALNLIAIVLRWRISRRLRGQ